MSLGWPQTLIKIPFPNCRISQPQGPPPLFPPSKDPDVFYPLLEPLHDLTIVVNRQLTSMTSLWPGYLLNLISQYCTAPLSNLELCEAIEIFAALLCTSFQVLDVEVSAGQFNRRGLEEAVFWGSEIAGQNCLCGSLLKTYRPLNAATSTHLLHSTTARSWWLDWGTNNSPFRTFNTLSRNVSTG